MAWQDIAVPMLRVLINDMEATPTYSDDRLIQVLLVSALYTKTDMDFDTNYTVNIVTETITPDPSTDEIFLGFFVMAAACQTDFSTYRSKALLDGISARCGPVSMTVSGHSRSFKDLLAMGPCAIYDSMKKDYVFGNGALCHAILSPFIGNNFDPTYLNNWAGDDGRSEHYT
jgi:hypothetical protein